MRVLLPMVKIVEIGDAPSVDLADIDSGSESDASESACASEEDSIAGAVPAELQAMATLGSLSSLGLDGAASVCDESTGGSVVRPLAGGAKPGWLVLSGSFGEAGSELGQLDAPWGITMLSSPSGALCVAERGGPRLQIVQPGGFVGCGMDTTLDAAHCKALSLPAGAVDDVQDIYFDGEALWVADMGNHCVHRVGLPDGNTLSAISGEGAHELAYPRAIATQRRAASAPQPTVGPQLPEQLVFICDSGNGRVMAYDAATFAHVRSIGTRSDPHEGAFVEGELALPLGVAAHNGEIYVVDAMKHRVSVFGASSGRYVRCIGEPGTGPGQLKSPFGVIVVRGMLLVTEATRVQLFTLDGVLRLALQIPGAQNLSGVCADVDEQHVYVCDTSRGCVYVLDVNWSDEGDRYAEQLNE